MNYRHAFHAGNFADVLKHAVLALVIEHLKAKPAPFRVIDTHAGIGRYDLMADEATRTGEWRDGIARIIGPDADALPPKMAELLAPYLAAVAAANGDDGELRFYPGSPDVARHLLRPIDRLVVNELHPEDAATLKARFRRDAITKVLELDAWIALKALLPPKERRGVILIDPPFEKPGELERLCDGLVAAVKRFANAVFLLWYPVKDPKPIAKFHRALEATGLEKLFVAELLIRRPGDPAILNGCGLAVLNPPHQLVQELPALVDFLAARLAIAPGARGVADWIVPERGA